MRFWHSRSRLRPHFRVSGIPLIAGALLLTALMPIRATSAANEPAEAASGCQALRERLAKATTEDVRVHASIRLAECLLSRGCAAPLSAELMGDPYDRDALRKTIDEAVALLPDVGDDGDAQPAGIDSALAEEVRRLRAFAQTFEAIATNDGSDAAKSRLTTACIELAIYMDSPEEPVAEAARLWQAAAYRRAGRPDRTLRMTRSALEQSSGRITDFFGRLERCRALADADRCIAALTLATMIEGKIDEWMIAEPQRTRRAARNTALQVRSDLYRQWAQSLERQGQAKQSVSAKSKAVALSEDKQASEVPPLTLDAAIAPPVTVISNHDEG